MRQIISVSLSEEDARRIKIFSKKRGFSSLSAYIKFLAKNDRDLISEKELLKSVHSARREYKSGKAVKAHSMADLL